MLYSDFIIEAADRYVKGKETSWTPSHSQFQVFADLVFNTSLPYARLLSGHIRLCLTFLNSY